ncbi:MAG TPA: ATP-binding protein [Dehalococcoidia bacterium]|nr:ATP-binding protein [Dehalococcoidia bacterium]
MSRRLEASDVRRTCDPASLGFESTEALEAPIAIIGQDRALKALQFGLQIQNSGFNIYAAGLPGTGKMTAITAFLERVAKDKDTPADWCYVHNFDDPYRPKALKLNAGQAVQFQRDMRRLIETAQADIRKAFESEDYSKRREATARAFNENRERLFNQLNQLAHDSGFAIQMSSMGILLVPIVNGKPLSEQEVLALSPEEKESLTKRQESIQGHIKEAVTQMRSWDREIKEQVEKIDREVVQFILQTFVEELERKYSNALGVSEYLEAVGNDIIENRDLFRSPPETAEGNPFAARALSDAFKKYQVNVLVDNTNVKGAPVVTEMMPTFNNLIGRMEKEAQFGALTSDFTMIRPGSIHRANGGYLVIRMEDIAQELMAWDGLKRCLRERKIIVEEMAERLGFLTVKTILPEPIPLKTKVILIGENFYYYMLYRYDREFPELFKVKADFDSWMDRDDETTRAYAGTLCSVCAKDNLRHLDSSAVAKIVEHSSRLAEDQRKLSTRFAEIADIIREANYWAGMRDSPLVGGEDVSRAIEQKVYRSDLIQERIREMIRRGVLKIDTEGEVVGQVNGLSVMDLGDLSFGRPTRITASTAVGPEGVVDIDREAKLGGPIHTKGVLILGGILAERFAGSMPLSLSARLVFEQSYSEVEGDSASSAELYGLLSSLAHAPIKQSLAVTGSVNQKGEVQAIGGVNQKVEGFFDICAAKGLTGQQGVLIPSSNVQNLMLREDIVEAIKEGKFSVYSVESVDEGIEILTGVPAGKRLDGGKFEEGSINDRAQKRLEQLARVMREFGKEKEKKTTRRKKENNEAG